MGCCGWFELFRRVKRDHGSETRSVTRSIIKRLSHEHLLGYKTDDSESNSLKRLKHGKSIVPVNCYKASSVIEDIQVSRQALQSNSRIPVMGSFSNASNKHLPERLPLKMTNRAVRSEDFDGNKMVNEYVRVCLIGTGSYGKVVLHRSQLDSKLYAIKVLRKSRLRRVRVAPSQTALADVMREVDIMKHLQHPRILNLVEVIDDPDSDHFYMVLEYVEGGGIFEGAGPFGGIGEVIARPYFRDAVEGVVYLHNKNVVHGDIKPENLLVTNEGRIKIGDFSISQIFQDDDDMIQRSPGTPVFTAPECCTGSAYHGKTADIWALGVTLYCMLFGCYPFIGETLQDMYDKIAHNTLYIPDTANPNLVSLLEGLLCKEPSMRMSLEDVMRHPWFMESLGHEP